MTDDPAMVGRIMRKTVGLDRGWAAEVRSWTDATGNLRLMIERLGVMAVINSIVGNNTHRKLSVEEFRGFALPDSYAPLIFVNGADAKAVQMFTLAHELAHVWLGSESLSGFESLSPGGHEVEVWCCVAAAEMLVPAEELRVQWNSVGEKASRFKDVARVFKVSPVVAARRALDLKLVDRGTYTEFYKAQSRHESGGGTRTSVGDFYHSQNARVGEFFATRVLRAAREGRIGFKEAYRLTGLHVGTFEQYAKRLGVTLP